jgi:cytidylate kinase
MTSEGLGIVVAFAGPIGSGKTTVASRLATLLNCPMASFGGYFRSLAAKRGYTKSRDVLQRLSEEQIDSLGPRGLLRAVLALTSWDHEQDLVVDGIRHPSIVAALRAEAAPIPVILVYLDVPLELRQERLRCRDGLSSRDLGRFDLHPTERDVGTYVQALADVKVTADGTVEETLAAVITAVCSEMTENVRRENA